MHYFNTYGWYTTEQLPGRSTDIAPINTSTPDTPGELRANFTGYLWVDLPYQAPPAVTPPAPIIPQQVTMRQACIQLEIDGLLDDVEALVATLPRIYQIEWQRASVVLRDNPLVEIVRQQKGMTSEQIDALFVAAEAR